MLIPESRWIGPAPLHIGSISRNNGLGPMILVSQNANFSTVFTSWPSANFAVYVPVTMPARFTIARFLTVNGNVVAGNVNVGLYSNNMALLMSSGSTAQAGTNVVQYIPVADQSFPAGDYFLALAASSTSARFQGCSFNTQYFCREAGLLQESLGSITLPSTMTPVVYAQTAVPAFGFTQSDTL